MLTIEPPFYRIRNTTVFRDHADADEFYVLPGLPQLSSFRLIKYRRDLTDNPALEPTRARGAGLAMLEVTIPPGNLTRLQADVASEAGRPDARVSPVLFRQGTVHAIIARTSGDRLIEDLVETTPAPLTSPHATAFALALTAEGATLLERAAQGGEVPAGVAYEMRFLALTPALHARVTMDYERMYDHFSASVGFTYYVSAKLDVDLAWLVEHDVVKIEIVAFTDAEDQRRQQALVMDLVKARIQKDFFRSGIPPRPDSGMAGPLSEMLGNLLGSEVTSASALFVLKARLEVVREQKTFELTYDGRAAVELTHVCTAGLSLPEGVEPVIGEFDLDDPFFSSLAVRISSAIDFGELSDLQEAVVHLSYGDFRKPARFTKGESAPQLFEVALTDPRRDEYEYEVEYHFEPDSGTGPAEIKAGPYRSRRRVLVIDPLAHMRYRRVRVLLGPVDLVAIPRLLVHLRVPGEPGEADVARTTLTLDEQQRDQLWRQRLPMTFATARVFARVEWFDANGNANDTDETEVIGDTFVALGPYRDVITIAVEPAADWTAVSQVFVEIRYQDGDYHFAHQLRFTKQAAASTEVPIPILDRAKRQYEWRQTIVLATAGTHTESAFELTDQRVLVVGQQSSSRHDVRVVWVGSPGTAFGLKVDFFVATASGEDEKQSIFLMAGQETQETITLPLDPDGRRSYRYEAWLVTPAGEEMLRVGEGDSNLLVLQTVA